MAMSIEIKLPALGDNIDSGDVLEVKVHEGDVIRKDQGIVELETDKATVEVPSTHAGKVVKVHIKDGQTVRIGAPLITLEEAGAAAPAKLPAAPKPLGAAKSESPAPPPKPASSAPPTKAPSQAALASRKRRTPGSRRTIVQLVER